MRENIEQIESKVENSGLYLGKEENGQDIKDKFYFGVTLSEGKTFSDFLQCFEPIHSQLESQNDLDVHAPATLIKPSDDRFYNLSLDDAFWHGCMVFRYEDAVYNVIVDAADSESKEGNLVDVNFRENNGVILGEITYDQHILFNRDEYDASESVVSLLPLTVPVQAVWHNVVKKLINKMDENGLLDNIIENPVLFTDERNEVMTWELVMCHKKVDTIDIGKITLDFNNDEMYLNVQSVFETPDGKEIFKTEPGQLADVSYGEEKRDYNVFQNNEVRQLLGLPFYSNRGYDPCYVCPLKNAKISEACQLKVSFTNYFGTNPDVNSVTFPLKDIASETITNDLLSKKFPDVFADKYRMVVGYVNKESASYLKPIVERYNLDNPRVKVKEDDVTLVQDISRPKKTNQLKL